MERYYICGTGSLAVDGATFPAPEIAEDLATMVVGTQTINGRVVDVHPTWVALMGADGLPPVPNDAFLVNVVDPDGSVHAQVGYDPDTNPNGYDWFEVAEDGTVTLHAA